MNKFKFKNIKLYYYSINPRYLKKVLFKNKKIYKSLFYFKLNFLNKKFNLNSLLHKKSIYIKGNVFFKTTNLYRKVLSHLGNNTYKAFGGTPFYIPVRRIFKKYLFKYYFRKKTDYNKLMRNLQWFKYFYGRISTKVLKVYYRKSLKFKQGFYNSFFGFLEGRADVFSFKIFFYIFSIFFIRSLIKKNLLKINNKTIYSSNHILLINDNIFLGFLNYEFFLYQFVKFFRNNFFFYSLKFNRKKYIKILKKYSKKYNFVFIKNYINLFLGNNNNIKKQNFLFNFFFFFLCLKKKKKYIYIKKEKIRKNKKKKIYKKKWLKKNKFFYLFDKKDLLYFLQKNYKLNIHLKKKRKFKFISFILFLIQKLYIIKYKFIYNYLKKQNYNNNSFYNNYYYYIMNKKMYKKIKKQNKIFLKQQKLKNYSQKRFFSYKIYINKDIAINKKVKFKKKKIILNNYNFSNLEEKNYIHKINMKKYYLLKFLKKKSIKLTKNPFFFGEQKFLNYSLFFNKLIRKDLILNYYYYKIIKFSYKKKEILWMQQSEIKAKGEKASIVLSPYNKQLIFKKKKRGRKKRRKNRKSNYHFYGKAFSYKFFIHSIFLKFKKTFFLLNKSTVLNNNYLKLNLNNYYKVIKRKYKFIREKFSFKKLLLLNNCYTNYLNYVNYLNLMEYQLMQKFYFYYNLYNKNKIYILLKNIDLNKKEKVYSFLFNLLNSSKLLEVLYLNIFLYLNIKKYFRIKNFNLIYFVLGHLLNIFYKKKKKNRIFKSSLKKFYFDFYHQNLYNLKIKKDLILIKKYKGNNVNFLFLKYFILKNFKIFIKSKLSFDFKIKKKKINLVLRKKVFRINRNKYLNNSNFYFLKKILNKFENYVISDSNNINFSFNKYFVKESLIYNGLKVRGGNHSYLNLLK